MSHDIHASTAPEGAVWVCGACGKTATDRFSGKGGWDSSCITWAVLCRKDSLVHNEQGRVVKAEAYLATTKDEVAS